MRDFGLTPEQAAAFVGNFAAESAYFNDIVEDGAIAKGWAGGTGFAQWTAARRKTFEAWIKRKGWAADSYEGNYSYLYRELAGIEPRGITGLRADLIDMIKSSKSLENATWRVAAYFEKPKVINLAPRVKAAKEALALYKASPSPATVWETDKDEPMPTPPVPTPTPVPIIPDTSRPAVPWYKSLVFTGSAGSLGAAAVAIAQAYKPGIPFLNQLDTLAPLGVAAFAAFMALVGRVTSTAQPLTTTQTAADKIGEAKAAVATAAAVASVPVQEAWDRSGSPLSAAEQAAGWTAVPPQQVPMTQLSLDQLSHEMPEVAEKLMSLVSSVVPLLGAISKVTDLGKALNDTVRKP